MFIKTISNSKYDTFKQCKLKYRYRYIDRLPESKEANTDALHFGSYIHKILEDGVSATELSELESLAEEHKSKYTFPATYNPKTAICLKNFLKFNSSLGESVATELVYEAEVKDDITTNGIIDRIIKGSEGGYLIIDYKTSKREKTKFDLYQDMQLQGYCYAINKTYKTPIENITCAHYYPITNNFVSIQYTNAQIAGYVRKVLDEVWRIRKLKKDEFCASKNEFCNWCGYKPYCHLFTDTEAVKHNISEAKERKKSKRAAKSKA